MSSHYNGRRTGGGRRRGVSPMVVLMLLAIVVAAAILVVVNLRQDKLPAPEQDTPPTAENLPDDTTGEQGQDQEPPVEPLARIEVKGQVKAYDGVYCVGDTGYEYYTYIDSTAKKYATCVNQVADSLAGTATVYDIIIPLSSGITLPDDLYGTTGLDDQQAAEKNAYDYMGDNVVTVPLYDAMMAHRTEYIYFRTDHHWTGTGAYYAYRQFCQAKGLTPHELSEYETAEFPGFLGTFYNDSGKDADLGNNPDTVVAYYPVSDGVTMTWVTKESGAVKTYDGMSIIFDESSNSAGLKYGAFLWGDNEINGINTITNPTVTDGNSCVVVKESFGNAFVPFLPDHYSTVYVIDYRYWNGSLTQFVKDNGVQDVIFCNNLSAIRDGSKIGALHSIL